METGRPLGTASGSSDTLPPVQQLWEAGQTHHPFLSSLLLLDPELHPFLSLCPHWKMGWCPAELEEGSTGSLWTDKMGTWVNFVYQKKTMQTEGHKRGTLYYDR